jgi:hypothetical protein
MTPEIEEFAKILVEWVRDAAIRSNDSVFGGTHAIAKRWKEAAATSGSPEAFAKVIIPDIVDSTIAHLLGAIDQEVLRLSFTAANGKSVDLATATDGLSGLYGAEWCEKYTKERFVDDLADLKDFFNKPPEADQE